MGQMCFTYSYDKDHEGRLNIVNWYLYTVHDGEINSTLVIFMDEALFRLTGFVNDFSE
jgi:hypothetical protein